MCLATCRGQIMEQGAREREKGLKGLKNILKSNPDDDRTEGETDAGKQFNHFMGVPINHLGTHARQVLFFIFIFNFPRFLFECKNSV